jgi:N-acetylmuramoyl-L-alanine amidase
MRHSTIRTIQRILMTIGFIAVAGIVLIGARWVGFGLPGLDGLEPQGVNAAAFNQRIAIISGHAGSDSGAVCETADGTVTLQEVDVNADVARRAADRLRRAGADVIILEEYDDALAGLESDVLLSIHADSCIDASGYKAAIDERRPATPEELRLLNCIDMYYPLATGLTPHPNSVTHNMTQYHAFARIASTTPAAILELGFLGGDRELLTRSPQLAGKGVADALLCFFDDDLRFPAPQPTSLANR